MKYLRVTMPDGSKWDVPAEIIARNKADHYDDEPNEFENTLNDEYSLCNWAANNMNWSDVVEKAVIVTPPLPIDYQEGWVNGEKRLIDK